MPPGVGRGGKWRECVWERREVGWPPGAGSQVWGPEVQVGKRRFTAALVTRAEGERTWKRECVVEEGVRRAGAGMRDGRDGTVSDSAGSVDAWVTGSTGLKLIIASAKIPRARVRRLKMAPARESVLFIGTQFSILYTSMYSPAEAATRVVFVNYHWWVQGRMPVTGVAE
jgi:hypothetical protein